MDLAFVSTLADGECEVPSNTTGDVTHRPGPPPSRSGGTRNAVNALLRKLSAAPSASRSYHGWVRSDSDTAPSAPTIVAVDAEPALRASLAALGEGRLLVIDSFRSWQCGTWIGDLTVNWRSAEPGPDFAELAPIEGVRIVAHRRLLRLLHEAGPVLRRGGLPFHRGLGISLARGELWIDYLDHPSS